MLRLRMLRLSAGLPAPDVTETRLVARQLDATHVVIRTDFAPRHQLLSRFPGTFHVPAKYARHMMVVADLESGDGGAIEDALMAAWALQAGHG